MGKHDNKNAQRSVKTHFIYRSIDCETAAVAAAVTTAETALAVTVVEATSAVAAAATAVAAAMA